MKADLHPKYEAVTATCSCGNTIQTRSTLCEDFHVDVCSPASKRFWTLVAAWIALTSALAVVGPSAKGRRHVAGLLR